MIDLYRVITAGKLDVLVNRVNEAILEGYAPTGGVVTTMNAPQFSQAVWKPIENVIDSGWIRWEGGQCPVAPDVMIEMEFHGGGKIVSTKPWDWDWEHDGDEGDIVAYREVS